MHAINFIMEGSISRIVEVQASNRVFVIRKVLNEWIVLKEISQVRLYVLPTTFSQDVFKLEACKMEW